MRKINKIKIYCNENKKSNKVFIKLKEMLLKNKFKIVDKRADLAIAIGGDGAFLRLVKQERYSSKLLYIGINSGTLGFLQEVRIDEIKDLIKALNEDNYTIEEVGVQETKVTTYTEHYTYYSLNEIVIRDRDLNTTNLKILIGNNILEEYVGDGILISTSVGSTAYNLSFGGSIIHNSLHTLQITPVAPLNSKSYRTLLNSIVVPEKNNIKVVPNKEKRNLLICIDGENKIIDNVRFIKTKVDSKRLQFMRFRKYNYWEKVNEKFLTDK